MEGGDRSRLARLVGGSAMSAGVPRLRDIMLVMIGWGRVLRAARGTGVASGRLVGMMSMTLWTVCKGE